MGWDRTRPVPWRRLLRDFAIYAVIMAVVLVVITEGRDVGPLLVGLVLALPLYVGLGYVMAKFGYQRKTLADLRTPRASAEPGSSAPAADVARRDRPAPTRRTSVGTNRPQRTRRKR